MAEKDKKATSTAKLREMLNVPKNISLPDRMQKDFSDIIGRLEIILDENSATTQHEKNIMLSSLGFQLNHLLTSWDHQNLQKLDKQSIVPVLNFLKKAQDALDMILSEKYQDLNQTLDQKVVNKISQVNLQVKSKISEVTETIEKDHQAIKKLKSKF